MKIYLFMIPALLIGGLCSAQTTPPPAHGKHLAAQLNLSPAQKHSLKKLHQDTRSKKQAITADTRLSPAEKKQQLRALKNDTRKQFAMQLTPAQKEKMKTAGPKKIEFLPIKPATDQKNNREMNFSLNFLF